MQKVNQSCGSGRFSPDTDPTFQVVLDPDPDPTLKPGQLSITINWQILSAHTRTAEGLCKHF
jgi:hypothetical protein